MYLLFAFHTFNFWMHFLKKGATYVTLDFVIVDLLTKTRGEYIQ